MRQPATDAESVSVRKRCDNALSELSAPPACVLVGAGIIKSASWQTCPVMANEVAQCNAWQRVRRFIPELCSGSQPQQEADLMVNAQADAPILYGCKQCTERKHKGNNAVMTGVQHRPPSTITKVKPHGRVAGSWPPSHTKSPPEWAFSSSQTQNLQKACIPMLFIQRHISGVTTTRPTSPYCA